MGLSGCMFVCLLILLLYFILVEPVKCDLQIDLAVLVDRSRSIAVSDFNRLKVFLRALVRSFEYGPDKARVGIVSFNERPTIEKDLDDCSDAQCLVDTINNLQLPVCISYDKYYI